MSLPKNRPHSTWKPCRGFKQVRIQPLQGWMSHWCRWLWQWNHGLLAASCVPLWRQLAIRSTLDWSYCCWLWFSIFIATDSKTISVTCSIEMDAPLVIGELPTRTFSISEGGPLPNGDTTEDLVIQNHLQNSIILTASMTGGVPLW